MPAVINNVRVIRLALLLILVVSMTLRGLLERAFRTNDEAALLDDNHQGTRLAIESIMRKIQEESQQNLLKATQRRVLLLRNRLNHGHANQYQCLHLASALAVQYNRTLLLPHDAGCRSNQHQNFSIPMDRLYNIPRAKRMLDLEELALGEITPSQCSDSPNIPFKHQPDFNVNASDPFSDKDCIIFDCEWADTRVHAPVSIIPHIDQIYFRYHDRYWDMAKGIVLQIMGRNNILAIQIRRGDMLNMTSAPPWPVLNCPASAGDWMSRLCQRFEQKRKQDPNSELTWNELFHLLEATSTHVDAIFVATNDVEFVRKLYENKTLPPLYTMPQFIPQIRRLLLPETLSAKHLSSTVELLVVEQIILALADYFIPSYLSTIPDHVFRMRLHEQSDHVQREQQHYALYASEFSNHYKGTKAGQEVEDAMARIFAIMLYPDFVKKQSS